MVNTRLTRIVDLLADKRTASQIARELKVSKVTVHKYIKQMLAEGFITESPESTSNLKFYRVNPFLTMSENRLTRSRYNLVFDPHNYAIKFPLKSRGKPFPIVVHKRNWDSEKINYRLVTFEKTTKSLIGYLNDRVMFNIKSSADIDNVKSMIQSIILQEGLKVAGEYGLDVDFNLPKIIRRELKIKDPKIPPSPIMIHADKYKKVYDDSVEFSDEDACKNFVDNRIIENDASKIMDVLGGLTRDMTLNLNFMAKSTGFLQEIRDLLRQLTIPEKTKKIDKGLWKWFN